MIVTLAGPGAGKTTDLIQQIVKVIPNVSVNREIAVITYTNASANDLREKLMEKMSIPKNLFVGTIHSFLFKYYIQPFAQEIGFETSVRRHIVGGANRTFISVNTSPRLCRIGTCRRNSAG